MSPPAQIGPYRIVRPLGEGGMGAVYEAIQEPIQRRVALKVLLPQYVQNRDVLNRFFNEARVVNLIEHPSIVQVSDYGQTPEGTAYLVMEYLRGETLSGRLARLNEAGERLRVVETLQLASQIVDALAAAHEKSVVHRDLKPANIMLVRDSAVPGGERAKILDFGIAKLSQGQVKGTATDAVIGTPQYMSPEQCRGAGGVDDKTDVYALGVILFEMIAGRPPFLAEGALEYMGQHAFQEPPPLRNFSPTTLPDVVSLVHRLLVKDKTLRPSMHDLSTELVHLLARISGLTPAATPPKKVDLDETRRLPPPASPSTLGGSQGQTLRPPKKWRARTLSLFAVATGACLIAAMVVFRPWSYRHAASPPSPASLSPRMLPPATPGANPPPPLPPAPPVIVSASAPPAALQKPVDVPALTGPKPTEKLQPKTTTSTSTNPATAARIQRPPQTTAAKPPPVPKPMPAMTTRPESKSQSPGSLQPPHTAQPAQSSPPARRSDDYEP